LLALASPISLFGDQPTIPPASGENSAKQGGIPKVIDGKGFSCRGVIFSRPSPGGEKGLWGLLKGEMPPSARGSETVLLWATTRFHPALMVIGIEVTFFIFFPAATPTGFVASQFSVEVFRFFAVEKIIPYAHVVLQSPSDP
jgi:hypothetical protein